MGIERDNRAFGRREEHTARQHGCREVGPVLPHTVQCYIPGVVAGDLIGRHAAGSGEGDPDGVTLLPAYRMGEELAAWPVEERQLAAEVAPTALSAHVVAIDQPQLLVFATLNHYVRCAAVGDVWQDTRCRAAQIGVRLIERLLIRRCIA